MIGLTVKSVVFVIFSLSSFMALIADESSAATQAFSENPSVAEISRALEDRSLSAFKTITPQNKLAIEKSLRRIASRQDDEVSRLIDPGSQADQTGAALFALAAILEKPHDIAFFQRFFENYNGTLESVIREPYAKAIVDNREGLAAEEKQRQLQRIASSAMQAYTIAAHRTGMDDAAVPALLRKLDHSNYDVAMNAAQALKGLQSSTAVEAIAARLRTDEAKFPLGPWDTSIQKQLDEVGGHDTRLGKARIYVDVLATMKTAGARVAAAATLDRWEAIYQKHPQRDAILLALGVAKQRDELTRTAGEVAASEPPPSELAREPANIATPATPVASREASAPLASTAADSSSPSLATLWTCAAAAIAMLVSLLVFWKRRT